MSHNMTKLHSKYFNLHHLLQAKFLFDQSFQQMISQALQNKKLLSIEEKVTCNVKKYHQGCVLSCHYHVLLQGVKEPLWSCLGVLNSVD